MERNIKKLELPYKIQAEHIGLPTTGAEVTSCVLCKAGESHPSALAKQFGFFYPVDTWKCEGVIHPVDPTCQDIHFELGLPVNWNGKAVQQGGAGVDGYVPPTCQFLHGQDRETRTALQQGYAVFDSDGGYEYINGNMLDFSWISNEECLRNYAYESLKKTKDTITAFLQDLTGTKPSRVYFYGGSNGGRETMKILQKYPEDYDGAICFFPVLYWTQKVLMDYRNAKVVFDAGKEGILDKETCEKIVQAALDICDDLDGVQDGVISNWKDARKKRDLVREKVRAFLTPKQLEVLDSLEKEFTLSYPLAFGQETLPGYNVYEGAPIFAQLGVWAKIHEFGKVDITDDLIARLFAQDPAYDVGDFDPEDPKWQKRIQEISSYMDANDPDLKKFRDHGGKLILVQGTVDPNVTAAGTVQYYEKLKEFFGEEGLRNFVRFYMAPGYGHGTDGNFLITGDFLGSLDAWVEKGEAPGTLTVMDHKEGNQRRTRPLYEYPYWPMYDGSGEPDHAENYHPVK